MKKNARMAFCMIGLSIICVAAFIACQTSSNDWPTSDEMIRNLQSKGYTITEDNRILIGEAEYTGRVVIAGKGSELVAGFWTEDTNAASVIYDHWGAEYQSDHTLRVGTTVYCGTERAIRHAGINLK